VRLLHSGKVRDVYEDGADLVLVASDRISVYDVVLPTAIPQKGEILTQLSLWWFGQLADVVPNHVISATDVPREWAGRAIRCRRLDMVPVECIARGYLAGLGLASYRETGTISGVALPPGLAEGAQLPEPVFTPTTKAAEGHDEPLSYDETVREVGPEVAAELRRVTLEVYRRGAGLAVDRGVIIADTKLEFGLAPDGSVILADEVLTPDSSRFWDAAQYAPGSSPQSFDKQFVRDFVAASGWNKEPPAPTLPDEVIRGTRDRYVAAFERLTGRAWEASA
jgi:phosphoribosylaminoimidazole-succinocarboxamide synthase